MLEVLLFAAGLGADTVYNLPHLHHFSSQYLVIITLSIMLSNF